MIKRILLSIVLTFFFIASQGRNKEWNNDVFLNINNGSLIELGNNSESGFEELRRRPKKHRKQRRVRRRTRTRANYHRASRSRVSARQNYNISHGPIDYYTNSYGQTVQSPTRYSSRPPGATAMCRDGTYSFSRSRRGTCSGHGGVAVWF